MMTVPKPAISEYLYAHGSELMRLDVQILTSEVHQQTERYW